MNDTTLKCIRKNKNKLLNIARNAIACKIENKNYTENNNLIELNDIHYPCFITLYDKNNKLRGCIGNIQAEESLVDNIKNNAIMAAFYDYRFIPITSIYELNKTKIEISIIFGFKKVNNLKEIILGKHGIMINYYDKSALFLPQVAIEQNWDLDETLKYLFLKANIKQQEKINKEVKITIFESEIINY